MSTSAPSVPAAPRAGILRPALLLDAAVSGANGVVYLAAAGPVGELLGLSPALLRGVGAFFLVWAVLVWAVARRPRRAAVTGVIAGNAVWAADSLVVAAAGWGDPTAVGTAWIVLQALVVAAFAALQAAGRREI